MRIRTAIVSAAIALLAFTGVASAHQAKSITASAVCGGDTTVVVKADVWGGVSLIVSVDGAVIYNAPQGGNDQSVRTFTFQTTTQPGGHTAAAKTSDQQTSVSTEFSTPQPCPTPTPSASPSPTPTPSTSPSAPVKTPRPTPPATSTGSQPPTGNPDGDLILLALLAVLGIAAVLYAWTQRGTSR